MKRSTRWCAGLLVTAVGISGCGGDNRPEPPAVQERAQLLAFKGSDACSDLEQYIEDTAVLQMRTQLEAERDDVPSWGWWWEAAGAGAASRTRRGGRRAGAEQRHQVARPRDYTTTNNQVRASTRPTS